MVHLSDHACFATAQAYGVELHDLEQPLLVSQPKKREIRARGEDAGPILLIPELCTRTGEGVEGEGPEQTACMLVDLGPKQTKLCVASFPD